MAMLVDYPSTVPFAVKLYRSINAYFGGIAIAREQREQAHKTAAIDCKGCIYLALSDVRRRLPAACPTCGRPVSEITREMYLVSRRRGG